MRDYSLELNKRVEFIRKILKDANADGIVYGNSGGKDCTLVGILCKMACDNVLGVIMPCQSQRNYKSDKSDAIMIADKYNIDTVTVDLSDTKKELVGSINKVINVSKSADVNIAPRLRMATLYAIAQSKNALVAGTDNKSEIFVGYFTKWGDGAYDFDPIADLTVTEVYEFLEFLGVPNEIIEKKPSAGLYEGQTDEADMGVDYRQIDEYIKTGKTDKNAEKIIKKAYIRSEHKRRGAVKYHDGI